jgi:CheY-like chemotaxis protein
MSSFTVKKQLACILLIDDDHATNFMHQLIINKLKITEKVEIVTNGRAAMDFLTRPTNNESPDLAPMPDLILLDINMPVMDGWQFLKAYRDHFGEAASSTIICMLSTALPDRMKGEHEEEIQLITRFIEKPLTRLTLLDIIAHYYPEHVEVEPKKDGFSGS